MRNSLSTEFKTYLENPGMSAWFGYLEGFRHALAHRIPLYLPPASLNAADTKLYLSLDKQAKEAARLLDFDEHDKRREEQETLGTFKPVMKHSFEEQSPEIPFHEQILLDFLNVEELGIRMLIELDRPPIALNRK